MKNLTNTIVSLIVFAFTSVSYIGQTRPPHKTQKSRPPVVRSITTVTRSPKAGEKSDVRPKTFGISVEKYVDNIEVRSDGSATQTWDALQRVRTAAAVNALKKFARPFNRDLEEMDATDLYILKADGTRVTLPQSAVQVRRTPQAEAAPLFSSMMILEINFDGLEIGDAIHYTVKLRTIKPFFGTHFDRIDILFSAFDWDLAEINLSAPKDFPLKIQAIDVDGGPISDKDGKARWRWTRSNFRAPETEELMLDLISTSPRVAISNFKDYEELGAAYWSEAQKKAVLTPEIQKQADEITKDAKTPEQQAYAIYEWVNKNIRYLSIVLDRGGWIPHDASEILKNRYGDCKDYTTILNTLLRAKGIESYPVIIRADAGDWFPEVAVSSYFNHAILYIPSLNLFADATAANTRLGLIPQEIVGKKGFLAGTKNGIISTPGDKPDDNQLLSDITVEISPTGSLKAISKNTYFGRSEILFRPMFGSISSNSEPFVSLLLSYYGMVGKGKILNTGNPFKVGEPFVVDMEVDLDDYISFIPKGSFRLPTTLNLFNVFALEGLVKAENRKTPLMLGALRFEEKYKLAFPNGVSVGPLPQSSNFSNAIGDFRNELTTEGGKVNVFRELIIKKDLITGEEYPQLRELINKATASFSSEIKYQAASDLVRTQMKEVAKRPVPSAKSILEQVWLPVNEAPLTLRQVTELESKLIRSPDDLETRKRLIRYYCSYRTPETPSRKNARIRHRIWFIENHPEMGQSEVFGPLFYYSSLGGPEFDLSKAAWLRKVVSDKTNARVRLNAFDLISMKDRTTAERLLTDGIKLDSENYEFPLRLSQLFHGIQDEPNEEAEAQNTAVTKHADNVKAERLVSISSSGRTDEQMNMLDRLTKEVEYGETALILLKKERSSEFNQKRRALLQDLTQSAFDLGKYALAKSLSTELILDFGNDSDEVGYETATHIGNIVLGRIALKENDKSKAAEYLLIAIRAPLRKERNWLTRIDTTLAKELFAAGEKDAVLEYLKLCGSLWNLKNQKKLYEAAANALELWQQQLKQGITPTFDFMKP